MRTDNLTRIFVIKHKEGPQIERNEQHIASIFAEVESNMKKCLALKSLKDGAFRGFVHARLHSIAVSLQQAGVSILK